jgi:hypothetical protein
MMKRNYDFSKGKRGALFPVPLGKTRITIRLDNDILDWFRDKVEAQGGGSYQTMINDALREHITKGEQSLEATIKRALQEVLLDSRAFIIVNTSVDLSSTNSGIRNDILPLFNHPLKSAISDRYVPYDNTQ